MQFLLSLLPDFLKVYLGFKANEAESLGKAEEKSADLQQDLDASKAEAQAAANAPVDRDSLITDLRDGKVTILLVVAGLLTSCAQNVSYSCPALRQWTLAQEDEIAANLSTLPSNSPLIEVGVEWARLRAESKACQNGG